MMMETKTKQERDEYKRKQQFDFLTSDVLKEQKKHMLAKLHLKACGDFIFYISAFITLSQAVLATLAQNKSFEHQQEKMNISIALLAAFSVFWQSLIKHWGHSGNSSMHESAATALNKIYNIALLKARQEKVDIKAMTMKGTKGESGGDEGSGGSNTVGVSNDVTDGDGEEEKSTKSLPPNEDSGSDATGGGSKKEEGDSNDTQTSLEDLSITLTKQFEQALESCTSQVPAQITAAFEMLDTHVGICRRNINNPNKSRANDIKVEWEKVYPTLYRQLAATIIAQRFWPYKNPDPEKVVQETMKKYLKQLESTDTLLEKLISRNLVIDSQYKKFEHEDDIA